MNKLIYEIKESVGLSGYNVPEILKFIEKHSWTG
jgi:hypothetical protein